MNGLSGESSPRVLVVDDDDIIRMALAETLAAVGMVVEEASGGEEALEAFKQQRPDVVLLDLMMPGMDGFETCRALRRVPGAEHLPVLVVTALENTESIERAFQAGATNFITKPINVANLPHQVQYALRASRAFSELRKSEERYALAARGASDGLWDWDLEADEIHFSPRWKAMLGYAEDAVGSDTQEWFALVHPEDRRRLTAEIKAHLLDGITPHLESEHRIKDADGGYRWVLCRGVAIHDAHGRPSRMAGSQTDISARKRAEARLLRDPLTGLPNRSLLMDRVAHRIQAVQRRPDDLFALLILDLDRFKVVNDSLGHVPGDQLLQGASERIKKCLRAADTLGRLGGDEFAVLLDDVPDVATVTRLVQRIQSALSEPRRLEGHEVVATTSAGIALSSTGYERAEDMLRDADIALYRAKSLGKARYEIFDAGMHENAMRTLQLESELRAAVERNELMPVYLPMVALATDTVGGFKALVRWRHPSRGLLLPEEFLGLAEETGLIVPIGRSVMRKACGEMRRWQQQWPVARDWSITLTLSSLELARPDLLGWVDGTLEETGLSPGSLIVELTEQALIENAEHARDILEQLHGRGIRLAIDDFGIGCSSFSPIHSIPFEILRVNRSFATDLQTGGRNLEVLKAIFALADKLGMNVVVESSEDRGDMLALRELARELGQGHALTHAMQGEALEAFIANELSKHFEAS